MIIKAYQMAMKHKDTKTMEKAASSYTKYNRVDLEDEQTVPYEPYCGATIQRYRQPVCTRYQAIPHINQRIAELLHKYQAKNIDIEYIQYVGNDIEELSMFLDQKQGEVALKRKMNGCYLLKTCTA